MAPPAEPEPDKTAWWDKALADLPCKDGCKSGLLYNESFTSIRSCASADKHR